VRTVAVELKKKIV